MIWVSMDQEVVSSFLHTVRQNASTSLYPSTRESRAVTYGKRKEFGGQLARLCPRRTSLESLPAFLLPNLLRHAHLKVKSLPVIVPTSMCPEPLLESHMVSGHIFAPDIGAEDSVSVLCIRRAQVTLFPSEGQV